MHGYLSLLLHAHLPFVRHPEHDRFFEETWLFEAITESYVPLLQMFEGWRRDKVPARLTLTLSPTLCSMLRDRLLQARYQRHLDALIELAGKEIHRTAWEPAFHQLANEYHQRLNSVRTYYLAQGGDLVGAFSRHQQLGQIDLITTSATHALLPLLAAHPPSLRAQLLLARDYYQQCFGKAPDGIWLPECAYVPELEPALAEAGFRWFILDAHGLMHARPRPLYLNFAPVVTEHGLAAFGRDVESAKQVWSRQEGYPGDSRYRDFYRDIGYDLDLDYVNPYLAAPGHRNFTGLKYHRITGGTAEKQIYEREAALKAADEHASHFLRARVAQIANLAGALDRPPLVVAPYDAELFGHWWYEGPQFLDLFARKACFDQTAFSLVTLSDYLARHPTNQVAQPAASSWGDGGYWNVWLNEANAWIYPHLQVAQQRMTELVRSCAAMDKPLAPVMNRALQQAGRELLLAQASDWPFIMQTGTSPEYARKRVEEHLLRFTQLYEQLQSKQVDETALAGIEAQDNIFPDLNYTYWA
jgi:1,4-alpha-glucan branching enzyme